MLKPHFSITVECTLKPHFSFSVEHMLIPHFLVPIFLLMWEQLP